MKAIVIFLALLFILPGAQAQTCKESLKKCKQLSTTLISEDTSQCSACRDQCSLTQQVCASEANTELLMSATTHHRHCIQTCGDKIAALIP